MKFIFLAWVGDDVSGLARGRVGSHVGSVKPLMGVCYIFNIRPLTEQLTHIDLRADNQREFTLDIIKKKLKV